jgi:hypothetical protein
MQKRVVATTLAPRGHHAAVNAALDGRSRFSFVVGNFPLSPAEGITRCPAWIKSSRQRLKPQPEKTAQHAETSVCNANPASYFINVTCDRHSPVAAQTVSNHQKPGNDADLSTAKSTIREKYCFAENMTGQSVERLSATENRRYILYFNTCTSEVVFFS